MAEGHPDYAPPRKRSLTLRGHRTSVSLEPAFWAAFREIAARRGMAVNALAAEVDAARPPEVGLASAMRAYVLAQAAGPARCRLPDGRRRRTVTQRHLFAEGEIG